MAMKPEVALPIALGIGGLTLAVHKAAVPPITDIRSTTPGTPPHMDVDRARRQATWVSIGIVSVISLLTKDLRVFVIGGSFVVLYDVWERYNNEVHPATGNVFQRSDMARVIAGPGTSSQVRPAPYAGETVSPQSAVM